MKSHEVFDDDVKQTGHYRYTTDKHSNIVATGIQTTELINMIRRHAPHVRSILDVGCGDGTFTFELIKHLHPKKVLAFDPAGESIKYAIKATPKEYKKIVNFQKQDMFEISSFVKPNQFDIVVVRGVLHHVDNPVPAIAEFARICDHVFILEPSGYNPILKVIEKTSQYHKDHGEKSYFPPTLNRWIQEHGYTIKEQKFFSIVPYFAPDWMVDLLVSISPFFEGLPFVNRLYCGTNLIYAAKGK